MGWCDRAVEQLGNRPCCGYQAGGSLATEPTALTVLALCAAGAATAARKGAEWLAEQQAADGSVGVRAGQAAPTWTTPLAVLAWRACDARRSSSTRPFFGQRIGRAVAWIKKQSSEPLPAASGLGHDSQLVAWPWVQGTHAWIEPTALCVLALKACGQSQHARVREAVRLLTDRLLPQGGCNYGNTVVLGTTLRAHLQPTGLALLALAGERVNDRRIERALEYLRRCTSAATTPLSLGWSLLGLAAHERVPAEAGEWLALAAQRNWRNGGTPWKTALLLLANHAEQSLLVNSSPPAALANPG